MKINAHWTGFTLVECLVATVILGIGLVGVAGMFACASISARKSSYTAEARHLAVRTIEDLRAHGYGAFPQVSGSASVGTSGLPNSTGTLSWRPYPDPGLEQGLKQVTLTLTWRTGGTAGGRYQLTTLVYKTEG